MKIIIISGKSGSGKSVAAAYLKKRLEDETNKVIITSFSKYLKIYAKEIIDWDEKNKEEVRTFLQEIGDTIRDDMNYPYFLIDRMYKDIEVYSRFCQTVIIDDARLVEELEFFKNAFEYCYLIHLYNTQKSKLNELQKSHNTEIELDSYQKFDYTICSDLKKDFERQLDIVVEEVR